MSVGTQPASFALSQLSYNEHLWERSGYLACQGTSTRWMEALTVKQRADRTHAQCRTRKWVWANDNGSAGTASIDVSGVVKLRNSMYDGDVNSDGVLVPSRSSVPPVRDKSRYSAVTMVLHISLMKDACGEPDAIDAWSRFRCLSYTSEMTQEARYLKGPEH